MRDQAFTWPGQRLAGAAIEWAHDRRALEPAGEMAYDLPGRDRASVLYIERGFENAGPGRHNESFGRFEPFALNIGSDQC